MQSVLGQLWQPANFCSVLYMRLVIVYTAAVRIRKCNQTTDNWLQTKHSRIKITSLGTRTQMYMTFIQRLSETRLELILHDTDLSLIWLPAQ